MIGSPPMRALCLFAALLVSACASAPSDDQCEKLRDHLVELQIKETGGTALTAAQQAQLETFTTRARYQATCTERLTRELVECALAATSLDEARGCDEKKKAAK